MADRYTTKTSKQTNLRYDNSSLGANTLFSNIVNKKRYFSSLDAEIYFGEKYIDDIVQIQWSLEQATMPLYGYNSYTFDDVAVGARQISGSFVINFTRANFMYEILESLANVNKASMDQSENTSLAWSSYFEQEHSPLWNKGFNIQVGYGDYGKSKGDNNTTMLLLYCVQLTGCQQVLGTDGQPVGEVYSFIAKDIRYSTNLTQISTSTDDNTTEDDTSIEFKTGTLVKTNSIYKLKVKYDIANLSVTSVKLRIRSNDNKTIDPVYVLVDASSDNTIRYDIPSTHTTAIDKCIANQSADNPYIIAELILDYKTSDGVSGNEHASINIYLTQ